MIRSFKIIVQFLNSFWVMHVKATLNNNSLHYGAQFHWWGNLEYQEKKHVIKCLVHIAMSAIRTRNLCVDKHYKFIRIQYMSDIVCCVDIGGIDDHHCLNFLCCVDIGGFDDHHCLNFLLFC